MTVKGGEEGNQITSGQKLRVFRDRLKKTQAEMVTELTLIVGGKPIAQPQWSSWENGEPIDRYVLAAISLMHPTEPRACMEWLACRTDIMPPLPEAYAKAVATLRDLDAAQRAIDVAEAMKRSQGRRKRRSGT